MESKNSIFGCFILGPSSVYIEDEMLMEQIDRQNELIMNSFEVYIWGNKGIDIKFKETNYIDYGEDMKLILFEFYLNPIEYLLLNLKPIEAYRKKEKAIGIPIIVWTKDFFELSEKGKYTFFYNTILEKLVLLDNIVKRRKLDTDMPKLKVKVDEIFKYYIENAKD